jgi:hypothetical protein
VEFREKFIAYIDVLGFTDRVRAAEVTCNQALCQILQLLEKLGSVSERDHFARYGPIICPAAKYLQKDLDFQFTQISDCAVLSAEVSPAGVINLVDQCSAAIVRLLDAGAMCRGCVTKGKIYHTSTQVIGSGYVEAHLREQQVDIFKREADERGTPFVEVAQSVLEFVDNCGDSCVHSMFDRMIRRAGTSAAIYPFKRFAHTVMLTDAHGRRFDPDQERKSNQTMRLMLGRWIAQIRSSVDSGNPRALQKVDHYVKALEEQIKGCDALDQTLDELGAPFPGHGRRARISELVLQFPGAMQTHKPPR